MVQQKEEKDYGDAFDAANIFNNSCDAYKTYFITPEEFTGLAFKLDLGSSYRIGQFLLKNTRRETNRLKCQIIPCGWLGVGTHFLNFEVSTVLPA